MRKSGISPSFVAVVVLLFAVVTSRAWTRLPDEGLKRAQQAEKLLAAGKPRDALSTLKQLDAKYPGEAALSLRLAQIHDQLSEPGAALFYYRRYARLAGAAAREEAAARLHALELQPGTPKTAEQFARNLGEQSQPVAPPTPVVERSLAALAPDGTLQILNGPKDLEKLAAQVGVDLSLPPASQGASEGSDASAGAQAQASMHESPASAFDQALLPSTPAPAPSPARARPTAETLEVSSAPTPKATPARGVFTPPALPRRVEEHLAASTVSPAARQKAAVFPRKLAQATPEEALTAQATFAPPAHSAKPRTESFAAPKIKIEMAPPPVNSGEAAEPQAPTAPVLERRPAPGGPIFTDSRPKDEDDSLFSRKVLSGEWSVIRLANNLPDSFLTFTAVPSTGKPINAILASGESRTLKAPAGIYEVMVSLTNTNYPPATLFKKQFECEMEAGIEYARSFGPNDVQTGQ